MKTEEQYPPYAFWLSWIKSDDLKRHEMIRSLNIPTNTKADLTSLLNSYFEDLFSCIRDNKKVLE